MGAVDLAPADGGEEEFDVAGGLCVVGQLLVVVEAEVLGGQAEVLKELLAEVFEVFVELQIVAGLAEGRSCPG